MGFLKLVGLILGISVVGVALILLLGFVGMKAIAWLYRRKRFTLIMGGKVEKVLVIGRDAMIKFEGGESFQCLLEWEAVRKKVWEGYMDKNINIYRDNETGKAVIDILADKPADKSEAKQEG